MRRARRGRASWRTVAAVALAIAAAGAGALALLRVRASLREEAGPALPQVPQANAPIELVEVKAPERPVEPAQDPVEAAWCAGGPEAAVQATEGIDLAKVAEGETPMRHALLRAEALLTLGRVEAALELNRALCDAMAKPTPAQVCEPLALEQHARIRMAGGETNLLKQEARLRAGVEGRQLAGGQVPAQAWATLGTLQKAHGECAMALENYGKALAGLDAPAWLRMRQRAPWNLQLLALVAMDRADCLGTMGKLQEARAEATRLTADLATALGEGDPLVQQAADLRDQLQADR